MTLLDFDQQVEAAAAASQDVQIIAAPNLALPGANQLLFFYKPECFLPETLPYFPRIHRMVSAKFAAYGVQIGGAVALSGRFLEQAGIMDRHYGFINRLSRGASALVSPEDVQKMEGIAGMSLQGYRILGAHEFLKIYPAYDYASLNALWLTKPSLKLRSGYYFQTYTLDGQPLLLINGFHPNQLAHFTQPNRKIILFLLQSDAPWKALKDLLAGDTFPDRADPASVRGELFAHPADYRSERISITFNFIHLSAGPFEALFEIQNFLSRIEGIQLDLHQTCLGRRLTPDQVQAALANPAIERGGKPLDLFTLTENTDTEAALVKFHDLFAR